MKQWITILWLLLAVNYAWCQLTHEFILDEQVLENDTSYAHGVSVDSDGTVFLANGNDGLYAFSNVGSNYILTAHINDGGDAQEVAIGSDGTVFLANGDDGLRAYNYDGNSFTNTAHINEGGISRGLAIGSDTTLFVANSAGIRAYQWNGLNFIFVTTRNDGGDAQEVAIGSDGTVFLANGDDGLRAYSFDGSLFNLTEHIDVGGSGYTNGVTPGFDAGTFFLANGGDGLFAYSYSGWNFTFIALVDDEGFAEGVATDSDGTVFLANGNDGLKAYSFDGLAFTLTSHINDGGDAQEVAIGSDGTVFLANGDDGLRSYLYSQLNMVGPIVVSEILQNPSIVADSDGEWFEFYNPNSVDVHLQNWTIADNGSDVFTISTPLLIPAHEFIVLGINADNSSNGNVSVDYQYSNFTLGNSGDELIVKNAGGVTVDSIAWDGGPNFPDPIGASMALLSSNIDNSIGSNWLESSTPFGMGDLGTPGLPNFLSNIVITPNVLSFDTVFVDESGELVLNISNDGNAPLQIDTIYTSNSQFSLSFSDSLIEASADLQVTFAPTEFGEVSGILYISSNDPDDGLIEVTLSGFGYFLSPDIELSNTSIDFGGVMDGLTGVELFQIYNRGEGTLELDTIYCSENFSVSSTDGIVAPGDSLSLEVAFSPDDETTFAGIMTIVAGNDPDEDTLVVALSGIGTAQAPLMTVSADELYFGVVVPNETVTRQITIYNEGMLDLEIEELTISGSELFTTTFSDASLAPGESIDAEFQFLSAEMLSQAEATANISASGVNDISIEMSAGYFGPVWHVSTAGDDILADGTEDYPFLTINRGIELASEEDTVLVAPGTYIENVNYNGKSLIVGSHYLLNRDSIQYIDNTIIDGNASGPVVTFDGQEDYTSTSGLCGFTITNGSASHGGGIYCQSSPTLSYLKIFGNRASHGGGGIACFGSPIIQSVKIFGNHAQGFDDNVGDGGGGIYFEGSAAKIIDSEIFNNSTGFGGIYPGGGGLYLQSESSIEISGSIISDNTGHGMFCIYGSEARISNSTIAFNDGEGIFMEYGGVLDVLSSIVWGNTGEFQIYAEPADSAGIQNSNIQDGWSGDGFNIIDVDPQFCDPGAGDYQLAESSPCIDSGLNGTNMGAVGVGCAEPVAVNEVSIPTQYMLEQNYPNPFNPSTTIRYGLPEETNISLVIYDLRGSVVQTLESGAKPAGWYNVEWNGQAIDGRMISTGIYFARIVAGEHSQVIKMLYLK